MTDKEKTLKNLRKVYNELPKIAETKKHIIEEFDMSNYGFASLINIREPEIEKCKTYGCLKGSFIYVFPEALTNESCYNEYLTFDYEMFLENYFPFIKFDSNAWNFLFDFSWEDYQPTFHQAMERLKYYLDHNGDIPEWDYQKESFIKE